LVVLVAGGIGWEIQVLLFAVLSVASVFAWRYYARLRPTPSEDPLLNRRAEQCVGRLVVLEAPVVNGQGAINVDGTTWKVEGKDFAAGVRVKVVGAYGAILKVEEA
jgi:membrane protein implicated in regulation of membrane protease activity